MSFVEHLFSLSGKHAVVTGAASGLAVAGPETRRAAKRRITALWAEGGTAIGRWLTHTADLLESAPPGAVRHASLYTDGRNEHETPKQLERALADCADRFVCDARGLGDDWSYTELLHITQALHGSARAVDAGSLTDDQAEDIGTALMRLERTVRDLARGFGLDPADLNLDLGPLGRLH